MDIWQRLKNEKRPIVLYGTGNGADLIMDRLDSLGIKVSGIFASSSFVRDRTFRDYKVTTYENCKTMYPGMLVLMCFGSARKEVVENVRRIKSECEILAPEVPVYGDTVFTSEFYSLKLNSFLKIRSYLADAKSVKTFDSLIQYKLTGNIDYLFSCETEEEDILDLLNIPENAFYMDLGAYNGDTVKHYSSHFKLGGIAAAEPDRRNFRKLKENTVNMDNITYYNAIISDKDGEVNVDGNKGRGAHETSGDGTKISSLTADTIIKNENIGENIPVFIKADVEGNEVKFIEGAKELIKNRTPFMRIACYHRSEDYYAIPEKVFSINKNYKLYMRHKNGIPAWETDYIFIPKT